MRWYKLIARVTLCAGLVVGRPAQSGTTVEVLDTYPTGPQVTLGSNQSFYVRLAYRTSEPVHIWVRPYFQGQPADAGSSPSRILTGDGETLGWFFFLQPDGQADEIRITAGDGSLRHTPLIAALAVDVRGSAQPATAHEVPAWLTDLKQRAEEADRADAAAAMREPPDAGSLVLFNGFMLLMLAVGLAAFAWPAWGLWRWRGGWRIAVAVPAAMMAFVVLRIVADGARDPTSHNLWPFEILYAGALSLLVMAVLALARKVTGAARS